MNDATAGLGPTVTIRPRRADTSRLMEAFMGGASPVSPDGLPVEDVADGRDVVRGTSLDAHAAGRVAASVDAWLRAGLPGHWSCPVALPPGDDRVIRRRLAMLTRTQMHRLRAMQALGHVLALGAGPP